jgi:hypothetical protein
MVDARRHREQAAAATVPTDDHAHRAPVIEPSWPDELHSRSRGEIDRDASQGKSNTPERFLQRNCLNLFRCWQAWIWDAKVWQTALRQLSLDPFVFRADRRGKCVANNTEKLINTKANINQSYRCFCSKKIVHMLRSQALIKATTTLKKLHWR